VIRPFFRSLLEDLNRVSAEVTKAIGALLNEHKAAARALDAKYREKYTSQAVGAWISVTALALPLIAPFVAMLAPGLLAQQYIITKVSERRERKALNSSLLGIVADTDSRR
jgi:hypothetical protein